MYLKQKVTREEARKMLRKSLDETIKLHKSFRNGTWKPTYNVNIVTLSKSYDLELKDKKPGFFRYVLDYFKN